MGITRVGTVVVMMLLLLLVVSYEHGGAKAQGLKTSVWLDDLADLSMGEWSNGMCEGGMGECEEGDSEGHGRLMRQIRYYISYGALAANRVPCPPRSGRSYYTRNCYRARGPVHPYRRSCTAITRCRRYTS